MPAIDAALIARYRAIRAKVRDHATTPAERASARAWLRRTEARQPTIRAAVEDAEHAEQAPHVHIPMPPAESWAGRLNAAVARVIGANPLEWAAEQLEMAAREHIRTAGDPMRDKDEPLDPFVTLDDELAETTEIEVCDVEDDDGNTAHEITLTIPADLWQRILAADDDGAVALVALLKSVIESDGDESD